MAITNSGYTRAGSADTLLNRLVATSPDVEPYTVRVRNTASLVPPVNDGNLEISGPRPWADVRAYCTPTMADGTADAGPAFAAAIAALTSTGGTVFVPPGVYWINSTVTINAPVSFVGCGFASCLHIGSTRAFKAAADDVSWSDLRFEYKGGGLAGAYSIFDATVETRYKNWRFQDCWFVRVGVLCSFDSTLTPKKGTGFTEDIVFSNCRFNSANTIALLDFQEATGVTVEGCLFENAVKSYAMRSYQKSTGFLVTNNVFRNNQQTGLALLDCDDFIVSYNTIWRSGFDITVNPPTGKHTYAGFGLDVRWTPVEPYSNRAIIAGNRIRDNGGYGIYLALPHCICEGNQIEGNGAFVPADPPNLIADGIYYVQGATSTEQSVIAHNICRANIRHGINVFKAQSVQIIGNQCLSNGENEGACYGINMIAPTVTPVPVTPGNIISGNVCFGNGTVGGTGAGISVGGKGHVIANNLTQDADDARIVSGSTIITRNGYGEEAGTGAPALDWPVGSIVKKNSIYYLNAGGGTWPII